MKYTTCPAVPPPSPAESSTTTSPVQPIIPPVRRVVGIGLPVRDGGPHKRVRGLEQVADREALLDALDRFSDATWTAAKGYRVPTEYDLLVVHNSAPEDTAFGRRRLREQNADAQQREVAA